MEADKERERERERDRYIYTNKYTYVYIYREKERERERGGERERCQTSTATGWSRSSTKCSGLEFRTAASKRRGNNSTFKDLYRKAKAIILPLLSYMCHIRSDANSMHMCKVRFRVKREQRDTIPGQDLAFTVLYVPCSLGRGSVLVAGCIRPKERPFGLGFCLRFRVWGVGFGVWGSGLLVHDFGFRVSALEFRVYGSRFRISSFGFGVWRL